MLHIWFKLNRGLGQGCSYYSLVLLSLRSLSNCYLLFLPSWGINIYVFIVCLASSVSNIVSSCSLWRLCMRRLAHLGWRSFGAKPIQGAGGTVDVVDAFMYLGCSVDCNGGTEAELTGRLPSLDCCRTEESSACSKCNAVFRLAAHTASLNPVEGLLIQLNLCSTRSTTLLLIRLSR